MSRLLPGEGWVEYFYTMGGTRLVCLWNIEWPLGAGKGSKSASCGHPGWERVILLFRRIESFFLGLPVLSLLPFASFFHANPCIEIEILVIHHESP